MESIKEQIKIKKNKKQDEFMSLDEYAMNKDVLEKAKNELEQRLNKE